MNKKPKIMISFTQRGENGGPYQSHKRIMESELCEKYMFIPLIVPRARVLLTITGMKRFVREIKMTNPDIVHLTGLQLEGFLVSLACKLANVKYTVLAIRGSSSEAIEFAKWKRLIVSLLENKTLKMVTVCYGVSNYVVNWEKVRKNAKNCYGYIYNLPHPEYKRESELTFRNEMGFLDDDIIITSTGRITREKGFEILLDTIKTNAFPSNVKFIVAGKGEYFDEMKKEIVKCGLTDKVFMLGYRNDIDRILNESDIFVICTLHETLCNSLIEAGQQYLPSVATNVGGIPEIIEDGYNGFLVEAYDHKMIGEALLKLVLNPELRFNMSNNARKCIDEKFNSKVILGKLDEMYRGILVDG